MKKCIIVVLLYSFLSIDILFAVDNTWMQKADFGGTARSGAVGFSIGSKGYIGTGRDGSSNKGDFWEYDSSANTWTQKADFGGTARTYAVGFSIGSKGYIGTGTGGNSRPKDFWEYDPAANAWTQKADFGGTPRYAAVGFSIGSKGYIGTGWDATCTRSFWEYDPATNAWTQKADFGGTARWFAVGFSIGSKGYIGTGVYSFFGPVHKDFWEYDNIANTWTQKADFGGTVRAYAVGFSIGGKGYTGTGNSGAAPVNSYYKDLWEYSPTTTSVALYFPHIATSIPWQTEIAIINTSDQPVTGALRGMSEEGQLVDIKAVTLSGRGRRQVTVAEEFTNHTNIGYITFDTSSTAVQGYTKFSRAGYYRVAIPAVKEVNASNIYVSHIASTPDWWTGVSLVNTTSDAKVLTITFNNDQGDDQSRQITLNPNEHRAFDIAAEFFNNQPQPAIQSAVITNASGVIGLELFGSLGWGTQLEGILLTDKTTSTIYYPHVAGSEWWTGIVAYNPSNLPATPTITPYKADGTVLPSKGISIPGRGKYIGAVAGLNLPADTAWFKIDSLLPLTGFELFGIADGSQLAAYAGGGGTGATTGIFPKIEKNGWTGIAFVNTGDEPASVTLTAYADTGSPSIATQPLTVGGHSKVVNDPAVIFAQDISNATYITYSSDKNVIGFQLNGSSDGKMLDGLPALK